MSLPQIYGNSSNNESFDHPLETLQDGNYPAVCIFVSDAGLFSGKYGTTPRVAIGFEIELPDKSHAVMYKTYFNKATNKVLLGDIGSWQQLSFGKDGLRERGTDGQPRFSWNKLLGAQATIHATHQAGDKTYKNAIISNIYPSFGTKVEPETKPFSYAMVDGESADFEKLPYFLKKDIQNALSGNPVDQKAEAKHDEAKKIIESGEPVDDTDPIALADIPF